MSQTAAATEARRRRSAFKRHVKTGEITLAAALAHPDAQSMSVGDLLATLPYNRRGGGATLKPARNAASKVCGRAGINPLKLVADTPAGQRRLLVNAYTDYRKGSLPR